MRPIFGRRKDMAMDQRQIDFLRQEFTVVEAAGYLKISRALLYKFITRATSTQSNSVRRLGAALLLIESDQPRSAPSSPPVRT